VTAALTKSVAVKYTTYIVECIFVIMFQILSDFVYFRQKHIRGTLQQKSRVLCDETTPYKASIYFCSVPYSAKHEVASMQVQQSDASHTRNCKATLTVKRQIAHLSQRDRAAGWLVMAKSRRV